MFTNSQALCIKNSEKLLKTKLIKVRHLQVLRDLSPIKLNPLPLGTFQAIREKKELIN